MTGRSGSETQFTARKVRFLGGRAPRAHDADLAAQPPCVRPPASTVALPETGTVTGMLMLLVWLWVAAAVAVAVVAAVLLVVVDCVRRLPSSSIAARLRAPSGGLTAPPLEPRSHGRHGEGMAVR
jgi:negative regulator of sigma E activity